MADQFTDSGPGVAGTTQDAAHMDALVVAQSYLKSGGIPGTSGTLVATQPATEVVINRGDGTAIFLPISATTVSLTASSDNYVDVTTAGAYTVSAVSVGAGAPAQASQTLRLYKATTSGTAITAVTQLATPDPFGQGIVAVDTTEAATNDALSVTSAGIITNMDRIRYQLAAIFGGTWNAAVAILDSGKNLLVSSGSKIKFVGQTGNSSATNVSNQAVGTFAIPSGSTSGGAMSVPNTLMTSTSIVKLTIVAPLNFLLTVGHYRVNDVAGTSFGVQWTTSAALTAAVDVHYEIVN